MNKRLLHTIQLVLALALIALVADRAVERFKLDRLLWPTAGPFSCSGEEVTIRTQNPANLTSYECDREGALFTYKGVTFSLAKHEGGWYYPVYHIANGEGPLFDCLKKGSHGIDCGELIITIREVSVATPTGAWPEGFTADYVLETLNRQEAEYDYKSHSAGEIGPGWLMGGE